MSEKANRFEDLIVWQMARGIVNDVYIKTDNDLRRRDYGFFDQIRRAAVSVMNNIAEGHERGSNKDFAKFLFIARASCGEVRSMLYVALDQGYIDQNGFDALSEECRRCSAGIWSLIQSLQRRSGLIDRVSIALLLLFTPATL